MNDPLSGIVEHHTAHPRGVRDILDVVSEQVLGALALPFFDGDGWSEVTPAVKAGIAEAGSVHVAARHLEPPHRADITLDLRTDLESPVDARYQIRGRCAITRGERSPQHREFALGVAIAADGLVVIDVEQLRAEIAVAILSLA